ncbi:MAG: hypothetical protein ABIF06_00175 [bacterium]
MKIETALNHLNHIATLVMATIIVLGTLIYVPTTVSTCEELYSINHGWPKAFITQDMHQIECRNDNGEMLAPRSFGFMSPLEYPFTWSTWSFLLDVFIFYTIIRLLVSFRSRSRLRTAQP